MATYENDPLCLQRAKASLRVQSDARRLGSQAAAVPPQPGCGLTWTRWCCGASTHAWWCWRGGGSACPEMCATSSCRLRTPAPGKPRPKSLRPGRRRGGGGGGGGMEGGERGGGRGGTESKALTGHFIRYTRTTKSISQRTFFKHQS